MSVFAVTYTYAAGTDDVRDRHRTEHVAFLQGLHDAGSLVVSGRLAGADFSGALLVLDAPSEDDVHRILDDDPFRRAQVIGTREVRQWSVVFGGTVGAP